MQKKIPNNDLIGEIYEASSNPEHWRVVLSLLTKKICSDSAMLIFRDFENPEADINFVHSSNQSPTECSEMVSAYENYYHRLDPMWELASEHAKIGVAIADSQLGLSRAQYEALCPPEYLEGFMRKYDRWYIAGSYIFQDEEKALVIALQRGIKSSSWKKDEMDYLTSLTPHFQRAFRIHREFTELRTSEQYLQACINRLLVGVIIVKPNGKIAFINELAKRTIAANPVLINNNGILKATPAHNDNQLQTLISRASCRNSNKTLNNSSPETVAALSLKIDKGSAPLPMLITPIMYPFDEEVTNGNRPLQHIAIFFADPECAQQHSQDVISEFYGLTRAEAGVAIAISNGYTVAGYAKKNNITEYTVRTQIKQIFQKLNVSRQAELVKVLLQTPNIVPNVSDQKTESVMSNKMLKGSTIKLTNNN